MTAWLRPPLTSNVSVRRREQCLRRLPLLCRRPKCPASRLQRFAEPCRLTPRVKSWRRHSSGAAVWDAGGIRDCPLQHQPAAVGRTRSRCVRGHRALLAGHGAGRKTEGKRSRSRKPERGLGAEEGALREVSKERGEKALIYRVNISLAGARGSKRQKAQEVGASPRSTPARPHIL